MYSGDLTDDERKAVASFERLAKRWPKSLMLFSWSGALCVIKCNEDGTRPDSGSEMEASMVTIIQGIPNDGGDP